MPADMDGDVWTFTPRLFLVMVLAQEVGMCEARPSIKKTTKKIKQST